MGGGVAEVAVHGDVGVDDVVGDEDVEVDELADGEVVVVVA